MRAPRARGLPAVGSQPRPGPVEEPRGVREARPLLGWRPTSCSGDIATTVSTARGCESHDGGRPGDEYSSGSCRVSRHAAPPATTGLRGTHRIAQVQAARRPSSHRDHIPERDRWRQKALGRREYVSRSSRERIAASPASHATKALWREHIGIEPTNRGSPGSLVLKTRGPTRYPTAPAVVARVVRMAALVDCAWVRSTSARRLLRCPWTCERGIVPRSLLCVNVCESGVVPSCSRLGRERLWA